MSVAELCAGYGGLYESMRLAGWPVELAWYAEHDPDASTVMAAHHPNVPNIGDITDAQFSAQEPVEVLAAGWPCQPVSGAGRQRGQDDERWLWPDVARAVRVLRPQMFVGENVPRLLSIEGGRLFGGVLTDLYRLGYTVRWTTVGACRVGLCHHRHRVFLLASREPVELDRHPLARLRDGDWETAADTLFGAGALPEWPAAGVVSGGLAWELPARPCGVTSGVALLPTPTVAKRTNRSPSPGAAVRPPLSKVLLPTPGARLGNDRGAPDAGLAANRFDSGRRNLDDAVALLPTPMAGDWGTPGRRSGDGWRPNLTEALLPTPTGREGMSGPGRATSAEGSPNLRTVLSSLLPTPSARDHKGPDSRGERPDGAERSPAHWQLPRVVEELLPTPRATDGTKGGPNQRGSSGGLMLPSAVHLLQTPTVEDAGRTGSADWAARWASGGVIPETQQRLRTQVLMVKSQRWGRYAAAIDRWENITLHAAPDPTEPGRNGQPRLSPRFVEFLMGLKPGWVTDHVGRNAALRILGNGVVPQQGAYALRLLAVTA